MGDPVLIGAVTAVFVLLFILYFCCDEKKIREEDGQSHESAGGDPESQPSVLRQPQPYPHPVSNYASYRNCSPYRAVKELIQNHKSQTTEGLIEFR